MSQGKTQGYTLNLQERIAEIFVSVVGEVYPQVATILRRKLSILRITDECELRAEMQKLFHEIHERLQGKPAEIELVAEMDAKLIDVQWRVRKTAGIAVVNAVASSRQVRTGDTFSELIERMCRKNLSNEVVQSLLQFAHVWPSLTTHPTNPTSVTYTKCGLQLDRLLADTSATRTRVVNVLRTIRDTSMEYDLDENGTTKLYKKKPNLEVAEVISVLNVIYDSVVGPQLRLREALDRFGYQNVRSDAPLLNLNIWAAGDGDGNPNMDHRWLRFQVQALKQAIRKRYVAELQHSNLDLVADSFQNFAAQKEVIISNLLQDKYHSGELLVADVAALLDLLHDAGKESFSAEVHGHRSHDVARAAAHLNELLIKCRTFGMRFVGTDVRHNSVDLMDTMASVLAVLKVTDKREAFLSASCEAQSAMMQRVFQSSELLQALSSMSDDAIQASLCEVGARVFLRMRVMAQYPRMFQKLIIAETRSSANAVAALLLLKLAGNVVAEPGAQIAVVPLFESREDLLQAPQTFHTLVTDPIFSAHTRAVGYFLAMIAKSDTTRLSGPGVQGRQEETVGRLMAVHPDSYGGGFAMHIFVGGGDDQMRGGGRIVETPHVLMLAANRLGTTKPARFAMTIQGLQMQLVFGSRLLSEHFIEAFAAQQMLAAARLEGHLRYRPLPAICNRKSADQGAHDFFKRAMDGYEYMVGSPNGTPDEQARRQTIVSYFSEFPSSVVVCANKSSRPGARKKTVDPLQGRAISLDQHAKHDGAYVTATLGIAAALQSVYTSVRTGAPERDGQYLNPLRHLYLGNKSFRDFVRLQAVILHQKSYDVAWQNRGGAPATAAERKELANKFREALIHGKPGSPREFLAYVEEEDNFEARMLLIAITGQELPSDQPVASVRLPLAAGWPDLAEKMSAREHQGALCQLFMNHAVRKLKSEPSAAEDPHCHRIAYFGYVGVNPKFSSPSFSLTMTDPQKEGTVKTSESAPAVASRLVTPSWAHVASKI